MKTLVVLAAFAAAALAAPTLENGSGDFKKTFTHIPQIFKRERKSVQELTNTENPVPGTPVTLPSTPQLSEFGVSGRSFGLKKPIIIKKKPVGYQVYRDSDEVPVDSEETCGSHVKVKFCDGKSKMKSTTVEDFNDTQMTEDDVKHSITMAKEALENIQRDLSIVERKPSTQGSSWKHGNSESDAELHQDIEVAREALEHIHKNFGNLESMSLHATTHKNADNVPTVSLNIAETEEQRRAQWKEAMNIIKTNFEIARNIEDSFKNAPNEGLFVDATMADTKHELIKKMEQAQRTSADVVPQTEEKAESEGCKAENIHGKSSEIETTKNGQTEDDMASSASTMSEKKMETFETFDSPRNVAESSSETKTEQSQSEQSLENTLKEKEAEEDSMTLQDFSPKNSMISDSMKLKEENSEEKQKNMAPKNNIDIASSTNEMKSVETEDLVIEEQKNAAEPTQTLENLETEKQHGMKSSEQLEEQLKAINEEAKQEGDLLTEPSENVEKMVTKSAEEVSSSLNELQGEPKEQVNAPHSSEVKMTSNEDTKQQPEMIATAIHAEQTQQHQLFHPDMRSAAETEDLQTLHQQHLLNPDARWAHEHQLQLQREAMAPTESIHPNMEHVHNVQHPGHHHHIHGMRNHFEIPSGQEHLHSRFSNLMAQEKSADPDMQAYYMRDNAVMASEGPRFRWKPAHDGRSAYPAPAGPAGAPSGAVGVFPNANVGSCGIPLLLSCNPSVVSGSLTKSPPSYAAPAYRTEDDFSFHAKRDVKKHESLPSTLHRLPTNLKSNNVLVAKQ